MRDTGADSGIEFKECNRCELFRPGCDLEPTKSTVQWGKWVTTHNSFSPKSTEGGDKVNTCWYGSCENKYMIY